MMDATKPVRKKWVDLTRGFCMLAILLFHTEKYAAGEEIIPYVLYVENALIIFIIISGYLFYKEDKSFSLSYKLKSILRSVVIPYFIFTTIIALPKTLFHHTPFSLQIPVDILTGQASWFVATLITAEIIFSLLLWITKGKSLLLSTISCSIFFVMVVFNAFYPDLHNHPPYFWHWNNAFIFLIFIYLGYEYHRNERVLHKLSSSYYLIFLSIILIFIKYLEYKYNLYLTMEPIHISSYTLLLADGCLSGWIIINICKRIHPSGLVCWTGSHSLVYYFISGAVPTVVSVLMKRMNYGYEGQYHQIIVSFIAVYVLATLITWFIYKYLPFMVGKKTA